MLEQARRPEAIVHVGQQTVNFEQLYQARQRGQELPPIILNGIPVTADITTSSIHFAPEDDSGVFFDAFVQPGGILYLNMRTKVGTERVIGFPSGSALAHAAVVFFDNHHQGSNGQSLIRKLRGVWGMGGDNFDLFQHAPKGMSKQDAVKGTWTYMHVAHPHHFTHVDPNVEADDKHVAALMSRDPNR